MVRVPRLIHLVFLCGSISALSIGILKAGTLPEPAIADEAWREALIENLKPGDVVFRRGIGASADAVATATRLSTGATKWTHVGIVTESLDRSHLLVAHASDDRGVVLDSPARFFSPAEASAGESISVEGGEGAGRIAAKSVGVPFGFGAGQIYCTALVVGALKASGILVAVKAKRLPMVSYVILPDDLALALNPI